jgi:hypothetical protein
MTVAIKRSKGDIIWFDAVLQFGRQYSASVTKHPLEDGSYITDHTTTENPVISLSGLITDVDFNLQRPVISQEEANEKKIQQKPFVNNNPLTNPTVEINTDGGKYKDFLPESISQFLEDSAPSVTVTPVTRSMTATTIEEYLIDIWKSKEEIVLYEFEGSRIKKLHTNCIVTSLNFNETPESGNALWPVMTFEQVSYAISKDTSIPKNVSASVKNKASGTNGKGNQAVAPTATTDQPQKTDYSKNTSQLFKGAKTYKVIE